MIVTCIAEPVYFFRRAVKYMYNYAAGMFYFNKGHTVK